MPSRTPLVSVVVPAFDEEAQLPVSLARIREAFDASPGLAYEIIVCDNNSSDATAAVADRHGCKVVFEPINQISRARNRGASVAAGEWLLFVDADSWPSPELIRDVGGVLRDPTYIGCGSTIQVADGPRWFRFTWESKNWSMRIFKWCPGAFILCRRDAFREIGGFSTEHYIWEEGDFVKRLKRLGAARAQRFGILHRHPFTTSGRKADAYSLAEWARFAFRLTFFHQRSVRDREFADRWYRVNR